MSIRRDRPSAVSLSSKQSPRRCILSRNLTQPLSDSKFFRVTARLRFKDCAGEVVLHWVPFLPANPDISGNGTRRRRSEAIEKPASCRLR